MAVVLSCRVCGFQFTADLDRSQMDGNRDEFAARCQNKDPVSQRPLDCMYLDVAILEAVRRMTR
jgi:hypothetical protein